MNYSFFTDGANLWSDNLTAKSTRFLPIEVTCDECDQFRNRKQN